MELKELTGLVKERKDIQGVKKRIQDGILEYLRTHAESMTMGDASRTFNISISDAYVMLYTLREQGHLEMTALKGNPDECHYWHERWMDKYPELMEGITK